MTRAPSDLPSTRPGSPSDPILRPWRPADADALREAYRSSGDLHSQFGDARADTFASARSVIEQALVHTDEVRNWAVVLDGVAVGNVGLSAIEWRHQSAWASYWLAAPGRGRGYATRALCTAAEWAFGLGLVRLELGHRVANVASCRVATRSGFAPEGIERGKLSDANLRHDVERHARLATDPTPSVTGFHLAD